MSNVCELLREVVSLHSPSGEEERLRNYLKQRLTGFVDTIEEDVLGNLILYKNASHKDASNKTLMLTAHMDEVAMMVTNIDEGGYIRVTKVGGVDVNIMRGQRVIILHEGKEIYGVIGSIPVHMHKELNPPKEIDFKDLWVDIGVTNINEVEKMVSIGDYVVIDGEFRQLNNHCVSAKACDNKAGVVALIKLIESIATIETSDVNIVSVFSAQEEVGLRGAETATFSVKPEISITIDQAHASDCPNICKSKYGNISLGHGPVIPLGTSFSTKVQKSIMQIATKNGIAFQRLALPSFSGTEATAAQTSGPGCLTGLITIPCRYMHSPVEVVSTDDIEACAGLLYGIIKQYTTN